MNIQELPLEILMKIFKHYPRRKGLTLLCKRFSDVAYLLNKEDSWLTIDQYDLMITRELIDETPFYFDLSPNDTNVIEFLDKASPFIREFKFNTDKVDVYEILQLIPNCKSFELGTRFWKSATKEKSVNLPLLEKLTTWEPESKAAFKAIVNILKSTKLKSFSFVKYNWKRNPFGDVLQELFKYQANIQHLKLTSQFNLFRYKLNLADLQSLELEVLGDPKMYKCDGFESLKSLKALSLKFRELFAQFPLFSGSKLEKLESLKIYYESKQTDSSAGNKLVFDRNFFENLSRNARNLKIFHINTMKECNIDIESEVLESFNTLEELGVDVLSIAESSESHDLKTLITYKPWPYSLNQLKTLHIKYPSLTKLKLVTRDMVKFYRPEEIEIIVTTCKNLTHFEYKFVADERYSPSLKAENLKSLLSPENKLQEVIIGAFEFETGEIFHHFKRRFKTIEVMNKTLRMNVDEKLDLEVFNSNFNGYHSDRLSRIVLDRAVNQGLKIDGILNFSINVNKMEIDFGGVKTVAHVEKLLKVVEYYGENIEHLIIKGHMSDDDFFELIKFIPNCKVLHFKNLKITELSEIEASKVNLQELKHLEVTDSSIEILDYLDIPFGSLEELIINNTKVQLSERIINFIDNFFNLKKLILFLNVREDFQFPANFLHNCQLDHLELETQWSITSKENVVEFIVNQKSLRVLIMKFRTWPELILAIADNLKNLKHLGVENIPYGTDPQLLLGINEMPSVNELTIGDASIYFRDIVTSTNIKVMHLILVTNYMLTEIVDVLSVFNSFVKSISFVMKKDDTESKSISCIPNTFDRVEELSITCMRTTPPSQRLTNLHANENLKFFELNLHTKMYNLSDLESVFGAYGNMEICAVTGKCYLSKKRDERDNDGPLDITVDQLCSLVINTSRLQFFFAVGIRIIDAEKMRTSELLSKFSFIESSRDGSRFELLMATDRSVLKKMNEKIVGNTCIRSALNKF